MNTLRAGGVVLGVLVSLLAGCSSAILGQWRSIEPADVPADVPRVRQITFKPDGQFEGRMTRRYKSQSVTGTYTFDGVQLVLKPDGGTFGGEFTYGVQKFGDVLLLTQNQATNRLCREPVGAAPAVAPDLPEEPAEPPVIIMPGAETRPSSAITRPTASRPAPTTQRATRW